MPAVDELRCASKSLVPYNKRPTQYEYDYKIDKTINLRNVVQYVGTHLGPIWMGTPDL